MLLVLTTIERTKTTASDLAPEAHGFQNLTKQRHGHIGSEKEYHRHISRHPSLPSCEDRVETLEDHILGPTDFSSLGLLCDWTSSCQVVLSLLIKPNKTILIIIYCRQKKY